MRFSPLGSPRNALVTVGLVLIGLCLIALARGARGADPALPDTNGCGDDCPGTGVDVVIEERPIALLGRSLDAVVHSFVSQTARLGHVVPHDPKIAYCMRCGSTDHAQGLSLTYTLRVATPRWDPPSDLPDEDRAAILGYLAAIQGHTNRHIANHRERLEAVAWAPMALDEIQAAFQAACEAAIAADNALDAREGCWEALTSLTLKPHPRSTCEPDWKAQDVGMCKIRSK